MDKGGSELAAHVTAPGLRTNDAKLLLPRADLGSKDSNSNSSNGSENNTTHAASPASAVIALEHQLFSAPRSELILLVHRQGFSSRFAFADSADSNAHPAHFARFRLRVWRVCRFAPHTLEILNGASRQFTAWLPALRDHREKHLRHVYPPGQQPVSAQHKQARAAIKAALLSDSFVSPPVSGGHEEGKREDKHHHSGVEPAAHVEISFEEEDPVLAGDVTASAAAAGAEKKSARPLSTLTYCAGNV